MSALARNLKLLMRQHQISETELSRQTHIGQPVIHRMAAGNTSNPKVHTLLPIARFFDLSMEDILCENVQARQQSKADRPNVSYAPCLPFADIPNWLHPSHPNKVYPHIVTDLSISEQAFATTLNDSSMQPTFPQGTMVIIDPLHPPKDRDYVIVTRQANNACILKQLLIDGDQRLLKPHNADFKIQPLNNGDRIIGPVLQARMNYKQNETNTTHQQHTPAGWYNTKQKDS